jgi:hypothetical protein
VAVLLILAGQVQGDDPQPQSPADDLKQFDGLWSGSWGGGESNGVVFQPVLAEILIEGEKFELFGFHNVDQAWGLIRIDATTKKLKFTTAKTADAASKVVEYTYKISAAKLTLIDTENVAIELHKIPLDDKPSAKVRLDILIAEGINEEGHLLTTEQSAVKVARSSSIRYQASTVARKIDPAGIFVTEDSGMKKISLNEARKLLKPSTPIAMAYRETDEQMLKWDIGLRHFQGSAKPESEAGLRTLARSLRLGTLVFVVSELQATPEP